MKLYESGHYDCTLWLYSVLMQTALMHHFSPSNQQAILAHAALPGTAYKLQCTTLLKKTFFKGSLVKTLLKGSLYGEMDIHTLKNYVFFFPNVFVFKLFFIDPVTLKEPITCLIGS